MYLLLANKTTGFQWVITLDLSKTDTEVLGKSPKLDLNLGKLISESDPSPTFFQLSSNMTWTHFLSFICLMRFDRGPLQLQACLWDDGQGTSLKRQKNTIILN